MFASGSDELSTGETQFSDAVSEFTRPLLTPHTSRLLLCTADSTGTHSLYTTYKDYEIMFHVSTLLPYTPNNKQQVNRNTLGDWEC